MVADRAWDVPEDFWIHLWRSREHRQLIIDVPVEPAGKGRGGRRSAPEFQRQVMGQMERCRRYPMRGPVALDRTSAVPGAIRQASTGRSSTPSTSSARRCPETSGRAAAA
jgi:hypothetical protein